MRTSSSFDTGPAGNNRQGNRFALLASFVIPAVLVVAFLFLLITIRNGAEAGMASVARILPVGYAFAAGMVASVNPCGFFLLPSYVSYHLGTQETGFYDSPVASRVLRALLLGGVATLGFVLLFATVGTVVASGGMWLASGFPYFGVAIGIGMVALGGWLLLTNKSMGITAASRAMVTPKRNLWNVFLFGLGYAVGSLSCTLPVFLVVVGSALVTRGFVASVGQFVGYALGMGAVLMAVTVGVALFQGAVARWLRGAAPYIHRASAMFLLGAGTYILYYWVIYADFFF